MAEPSYIFVSKHGGVEKMMSLFLKEKPVKALMAISNSNDQIYASQIAEEIDTTYSHTVKIISRLKEQDMVKSSKQGRKKVLRLTDKGRSYANLFEELSQVDDEQIDLMSRQTSVSEGWKTDI